MVGILLIQVETMLPDGWIMLRPSGDWDDFAGSVQAVQNPRVRCGTGPA